MKTINYNSLSKKMSHFKKSGFLPVYFLVLLPMCFMMLLAKYVDCIAYTEWSIEIWDALFSGRIREYFLVSAENIRKSVSYSNPFGCLYLLPWAIWNFPVWLSRIIMGNSSVGTTLCLAYSKLFLLFCAHIMSIYCIKIIRLFTDNESLDISVFLYVFGCGTMFLSIAFFGQDEIIYMTTLVMAVYYTIINNKKLGYILLGVSVTLCNIMIVPTLAILLIKEKNMFKTGILLVCFVAPEKLVSHFCGIGKLSEIAQHHQVGQPFIIKDLFDWFFMRTLFQASDFRISFLAVSLILIYAFCYLQKSENSEQESYRIILYPALILFAMNIFSWLHCYRWFTYFPLLSICVFIQGHRNDSLKCGLLFLTLFEHARVGMMVTLDYCLRFDSLKLGIINRFWERNGYTGDLYSFFHTILGQSKFDVYYTLVSSLGIACTMLLLIILFKKNWNVNLNISQKALTIIHTILPLLITICVMTLPIVCSYLVKQNCYNSDTSYSTKTISLDMKSQQNTQATFPLRKTFKIKELNFRAFTWHNDYGENKLVLTIKNADSVNDAVYETTVLLNSIKNNDLTTIPLKDCILPAGNYIINFQTNNDLDADFALAANPGQPRHHVIYDGQTFNDTDLCIEIIGEPVKR